MVLCALSGTIMFFIAVKILAPLIQRIPPVREGIVWYSVHSLAVFPVHLTIKVLSIPLLEQVSCHHWAVLFLLMISLSIPLVNLITIYCPWMLGQFSKRIKARWSSPRFYPFRKTMYRYAKSVNRRQCCLWKVSFPYLEGSSDLLRNHNMLQIVNPTNYSCCFHNISFSFTDVGIRIPTGASALGMTRRYDSRSDYRPPLSLRDECAHWRGNPFRLAATGSAPIAPLQ